MYIIALRIKLVIQERVQQRTFPDKRDVSDRGIDIFRFQKCGFFVGKWKKHSVSSFQNAVFCASFVADRFYQCSGFEVRMFFSVCSWFVNYLR